MAVIIFGFWNVPGIRHLINPLKLLTIGAHEMFHIIAVSSFFFRYRLHMMLNGRDFRTVSLRQYYLEVEYYE